MNPAEQKNHKRVTDDLRRDLDTLKSDMGTLLGGVANTAQDRTSKVQKNLDSLASAHHERLVELREDCDGVISRRDALDAHFWDFVDAGFWARIRWILFGFKR